MAATNRDLVAANTALGAQIAKLKNATATTAQGVVPGSNPGTSTPTLSLARIADSYETLKTRQGRRGASAGSDSSLASGDGAEPPTSSASSPNDERRRKIMAGLASFRERAAAAGAGAGNYMTPEQEGELSPADARSLSVVHPGAGGPAGPGAIALNQGAGQGTSPVLVNGQGGQKPKSATSPYFSSKLEVFESAKYVPPNSYAMARVLVGADAATGTSYSADPKPVLLRILSQARHVETDGRIQTTDITGCLVNGAAYGELASEKVYIKLQRISCPIGQNRFAVATVEGYVSSHGKAGVRGQVISREGSLTARALVAGTLNGLGQAMSRNVNSAIGGLNSTVSSGGALGAKELSPGEIASASVGTGVSSAASMLADYYIKRAEQYSPVIEMPTGISVEIVFLTGFEVK